MAQGKTIGQAAEYINAELNLDCEKSTYYRAYHYDPRPWELTSTEVAEIIQEAEEVDAGNMPEPVEPDNPILLKYARLLATIREERKQLNLERAVLDGKAREFAGKSLIANIIKDLFNKEIDVEPSVVSLHMSANNLPIFAYGDVHWGYQSKRNQVKYNPEIAAGRVNAIFRVIAEQVEKYKFKEIYIVDLADDIEGAALRVSQLVSIAEIMTEQANGYARFISRTIRDFAEAHPDVKITMIHINDDNHAQLRLYKTKRNEMDDSLQLLITSQVQSAIDTAHEYGKLLNLTYIAESEVILTFKNGAKLLISHGHRYGRSDDILSKASSKHNQHINYFLAGHWHSYSHKNKNMYDGIQECLIFAPAVTSDTDHSESLFLSSMPGFIRLNLSNSGRYLNSVQYLFEEHDDERP